MAIDIVTMKGWRERQHRICRGGGFDADETRRLPEEAALAISCNGSTQAVMMGTPADLQDFATGFLLTEGIAAPDEIESLEIVETALGIDIQARLCEPAAERLSERRRSMAGPVGCGLCGIESLEAAMRLPPSLAHFPGPRIEPQAITSAMAQLPTLQPLHDATRSVHGAAFLLPGNGLVLAREDVGRHNALDKLIGAMTRDGLPAASGAIVMTSRISIDIVQKTLRAGVPVLVAVSAPTIAALDLAERCGLTVIAQAREDRFEIYTRADRIKSTEASS